MSTTQDASAFHVAAGAPPNGRVPLTGEVRFLFLAITGAILVFGLPLYLLSPYATLFWAWMILEPRSAILIGAGYTAAILYFLLAVRENDWYQAQPGVGSLLVFLLILLLATILHWNLFRPYYPATLIWLAIYYGGPLLVAIIYRLQSVSGRIMTIEGPELAPAWSIWLIVRGLFYLVLTLIGLVFAESISAAWPWGIRPLELRVFLGQVAINGWAAVIVLRYGAYWGRLRLELVLYGAFGLLQIVGLALSSTPYNWSAPLGIFLPLMFLEWFITPAVLLWIYERKQTQTPLREIG